MPIRKLNQDTSAVLARVEASVVVRPARRTLPLPTEADLAAASPDSAGTDAVLADRADPARW